MHPKLWWSNSKTWRRRLKTRRRLSWNPGVGRGRSGLMRISLWSMFVWFACNPDKRNRGISSMIYRRWPYTRCSHPLRRWVAVGRRSIVLASPQKRAVRARGTDRSVFRAPSRASQPSARVCRVSPPMISPEPQSPAPWISHQSIHQTIKSNQIKQKLID